ncbi:hypothetical protein [Isoptericola sp. NPDC056605]|uniref:hypothetical protein n=1 Tax=Isoptericola sp. NPDC056605 TaxID=3345876 RepID=UPI0036CF178A
MPPIDAPWTRVRTPVAVPKDPTPAALLALSDVDLAELLRSHLVPRDQSKAGRDAWDKLWLAVRADDKLADRAYDILEEFLNATQDALERDEVPEAQKKRAAKFIELCQQSWARIDRGGSAPQYLDWAGKAGDFQPRARYVVNVLVTAIARHRATVREGSPGTPADDELWAALREVKLDPDEYDYTEQLLAKDEE